MEVLKSSFMELLKTRNPKRNGPQTASFMISEVLTVRETQGRLRKSTMQEQALICKGSGEGDHHTKAPEDGEIP
jgi:hypothetical protein